MNSIESASDSRRRHRSGLTLWRDRAGPGLEAPALEGDAQCEVAVVGGGISGALVALSLVREGLDTVLLERAELAAESSAASTGLLMYEIDTPLSALIPKIGQERAVHAYRRGLAAIDELEEIADQLPDRCGFERQSCLLRASHDAHVLQLRDEFECRRRFGFDVRWLEASELYSLTGLAAPAAIYSSGDGLVDPYRLTCQVLAHARNLGARLFAGTLVNRVCASAAGVRLMTNSGNVVARQLVYATGYGIDHFLGQRVGKLQSTYVVATQPLAEFPAWLNNSLAWETDRPYLYLRRADDQRIIAGGEDTSFSTDHRRDDLVDKKIAQLVNRLQELVPGIEIQPDYAWAGTFGETDNGLARIGSPRGREREYFAIGYGGNGITFSVIAARTITDLIVGRPNPDAQVFGFSR